MININLDISSPVITLAPEKEEELRMELRRAMLQFIFKAADAVGVNHATLKVDGTIMTKDE